VKAEQTHELKRSRVETVSLLKKDSFMSLRGTELRIYPPESRTIS
jgi:hypothetical protein